MLSWLTYYRKMLPRRPCSLLPSAPCRRPVCSYLASSGTAVRQPVRCPNTERQKNTRMRGVDDPEDARAKTRRVCTGDQGWGAPETARRERCWLEAASEEERSKRAKTSSDVPPVVCAGGKRARDEAVHDSGGSKKAKGAVSEGLGYGAGVVFVAGASSPSWA